MALTEQQLTEIHEAQAQALEAINTPDEIIYPIQRNIEIARDILVKEHTPKHLWSNVSIWTSAYLAAKAEGLLVQRPSRAEREAELHAKDRADGRAKRHGVEYEKRDDPREVIRKMVDDIANFGKPKSNQDTATPEAIDWPSLTADYEQLSPEDQAKFRKLSSENMKIWLKRRAEARHRERFGDATGVSVRGDNHIS